jgi:hypothetical protein
MTKRVLSLLGGASIRRRRRSCVSNADRISLTHPERRVRVAAFVGVGHAPSDSPLQLAACELLIRHSRLIRAVDLRHRGPQRVAYEHINTWEDRCCDALLCEGPPRTRR